jgi:hypothetical protein
VCTEGPVLGYLNSRTQVRDSCPEAQCPEVQCPGFNSGCHGELPAKISFGSRWLPCATYVAYGPSDAEHEGTVLAPSPPFAGADWGWGAAAGGLFACRESSPAALCERTGRKQEGG